MKNRQCIILCIFGFMFFFSSCTDFNDYTMESADTVANVSVDSILCDKIEEQLSSGGEAHSKPLIQGIQTFMESADDTTDGNAITEESQTTQPNPENEKTEKKKNEYIQVVNRYLINQVDSAKIMLEAVKDGRNVEEFIQWLCDDLDNASLKLLADSLLDGSFSERKLYDITGESIYVLVDRFTGGKSDGTIIHKTASEDDVIHLTFTGDICLEEDGFVLDYYDTTKELSDWIGKEIINEMNRADICMVNHEFCVSNQGEPLKGKYYTFRANPQRLEILNEMGVDIVSLANNHVYDYGNEAFIDTLKYIKEYNMAFVGGGRNYEEAKKPVYYVINGIKIGFVAASNAEKNRYTPEAKSDASGIILMYDTENMKNIISSCAKQCDIVIAYLHWGTEDSNLYEQYQTDIAQAFMDCGADMIVGGHPHVLQGIGYVKDKPVIYSMGDFWFNGTTTQTAILNVDVTIDGIQKLQWLPCLQKKYHTNMILDETEREQSLSYMRELSPGVTINSSGIITNEK